jgi:hypothetical protein
MRTPRTRARLDERDRVDTAGRRSMKKVLGICGVIGLAVLPADAGQAITMKVTPLTSFAPSHIRVVARIEPSAANRALEIVADGENFYRSTMIPLEGDAAPKMFDMVFVNIPGGQYDVSAVLMDASGQRRALAHQTATVISTGF